MRRGSLNLGALELVGITLLSTALSPLPSHAGIFRSHSPAQVAATEESQGDEDLNEFLGHVRHDLAASRARTRSVEVMSQPATPAPQTATLRNITRPVPALNNISISNEARGIAIPMPVVGVTRDEIENSWGDPRDGGRRKHRGIDIFAPKGTEVIAVTDGYLSFVGEQPKGGRCLWLTSNDGMSFYYAHLDRWAPGIYEGMEIKTGDVLGYVGNTGNAAHTSSHLHFSVLDNDEAVNPYVVLKYGRTGGKVTLHGGLSASAGK